MDLGMEQAGFVTTFHVENDKHCRNILGKHWEHTPCFGDICDVNGADLPPVEVLSFGSPCQDLSIAGNREGFGGSKSGLFVEAIRVIKEMRGATNGEFPRWVIWENVPGSLSSAKGEDFGQVLDDLADTGALVIEWAVLDARWLGVPQRRRRVFVIACFDHAAAELCPNPLLPIAESSGGNPVPRRNPPQIVAALTSTGVGTCGADDNQAQAGHLIPEVLAFSENQRAEVLLSDNAYQLSGQGGKPGQGYAAVMSTQADQLVVRRLTPVECERLMGWPDDHTRWGADGSQQTDRHRYKQCGNGITSVQAAWIGKQIALVEAKAASVKG